MNRLPKQPNPNAEQVAQMAYPRAPRRTACSEGAVYLNPCVGNPWQPSLLFLFPYSFATWFGIISKPQLSRVDGGCVRRLCSHPRFSLLSRSHLTSNPLLSLPRADMRRAAGDWQGEIEAQTADSLARAGRVVAVVGVDVHRAHKLMSDGVPYLDVSSHPAWNNPAATIAPRLRRCCQCSAGADSQLQFPFLPRGRTALTSQPDVIAVGSLFGNAGLVIPSRP